MVAASTAFQFANNVHMYGSTFTAHGNIGGGGYSGAGTILAVGAGISDVARLQNTNLFLQMEADSGSSSITDFAITGAANSGIIGCFGQIAFINAGGTVIAGSLAGSAMLAFQGLIENCPLASSVAGSKFQFGRTLTGVDSTAQGGRLDAIGSVQYISDTVQALTSNGTIKTATDGMYGLIPVTETAAVTGMILEAPSRSNSVIKIINRSAFTIRFAASATSHVANSTSCVIPASAALSFSYDVGTSLWYPG